MKAFFAHLGHDWRVIQLPFAALLAIQVGVGWAYHGGARTGDPLGDPLWQVGVAIAVVGTMLLGAESLGAAGRRRQLGLIRRLPGGVGAGWQSRLCLLAVVGLCLGGIPSATTPLAGWVHGHAMGRTNAPPAMIQDQIMGASFLAVGFGLLALGMMARAKRLTMALMLAPILAALVWLPLGWVSRGLVYTGPIGLDPLQLGLAALSLGVAWSCTAFRFRVKHPHERFRPGLAALWLGCAALPMWACFGRNMQLAQRVELDPARVRIASGDLHSSPDGRYLFTTLSRPGLAILGASFHAVRIDLKTGDWEEAVPSPGWWSPAEAVLVSSDPPTPLGTSAGYVARTWSPGQGSGRVKDLPSWRESGFRLYTADGLPRTILDTQDWVDVRRSLQWKAEGATAGSRLSMGDALPAPWSRDAREEAMTLAGLDNTFSGWLSGHGFEEAADPFLGGGTHPMREPLAPHPQGRRFFDWIRGQWFAVDLPAARVPTIRKGRWLVTSASSGSSRLALGKGGRMQLLDPETGMREPARGFAEGDVAVAMLDEEWVLALDKPMHQPVAIHPETGERRVLWTWPWVRAGNGIQSVTWAGKRCEGVLRFRDRVGRECLVAVADRVVSRTRWSDSGGIEVIRRLDHRQVLVLYGGQTVERWEIGSEEAEVLFPRPPAGR